MTKSTIKYLLLGFIVLLTFSSTAQPDLIVESVSLETGIVSTHDVLNANVTISNVGDMDVLNMYSIGVYVGSTNNFEESTQRQTSFTGPLLQAGESGIRTISIELEPSDGIGTVYFFFTADENEVISESNESNNVSDAIEVLVFPSDINLALSEINLSQTTIDTDDVLNVSFRIANSGTTNAAFVRHTIYLGDNSDFEIANKIDLTSFSLASVNAGSSFTFPRDLDLGFSNGEYHIFVQIDSDEKITESNETDNIVSAPLTISGASIDLTALNQTAWGELFPGSDFFIGYNLVNTGTHTLLGEQVVQYFLSADELLGGEDVLLGENVFGYEQFRNGFGSGSTHSVGSVELSLSEDLSAGSYHVLISIDHLNAVNETDESNNLLSIPIDVIELQPDLRVTDVSLAGDEFIVGNSTQLSYRIENLGDLPATGFNIASYLSIDEEPSNDDILIDDHTYSEVLAATSDVSVMRAIVIPNDVTEGTYFVIVNIDANDLIDEKDEDNNTLVSAASYSVEEETVLDIDNIDSHVIFPNPARKEIFVKNSSQIERASMIDLQGKKLAISIKNGKVDVADIAPGVYTLVLETKKTTITQKVIVVSK